MRTNIVNYRAAGRAALGSLVLAVTVLGCGKREAAAPPASTVPKVHVAHPQRRTIERIVGQPGFIHAYEQTAIFPKIGGYIDRWTVDIGDRIRRDQVMANLFVPELDAEYAEKKALVAQNEVSIESARQYVNVAEHTLSVARADVDKAKADVANYQSAVDRWESEVNRLTGLVAQKVVDLQILDESRKQLKSNLAQRAAAEAGIQAAQAVALARQADVDKSKVDVLVAQAKARVSQADEQRYAALVSYTKLTAPYDGVVVLRNANTGDFVRPAGGDKSVSQSHSELSAELGAPVYVVARTDIVRIYVDVPEADANFVGVGTDARVRVQALGDAEFSAGVTRTSWSLNVQTRTLRTEIDLPNHDAKLLPGMYAYGMLTIKRPGVFAVPSATIVELGNQPCCYLLVSGKAVKTPVQSGVSDGQWTEVSKKLVAGAWIDFDGDEQVIEGNLAQLTDGQGVDVTQPTKP